MASADVATSDTSNASSVGADVFGLPLITMLWLLAGLLAVVVGFTISRVRRTVGVGDLSSANISSSGVVTSIGEKS